MNRKAVLVCTFAVLAGLLTGCAYKDIDKRFFVTSIGVDYSKNPQKPYHVSLKLAIPSPQVQPGKTKFQLITEDADSIAEAVRVMKSKVDKDFDFGHCRVLVFGREILRKHQAEVLNWFMRRRDIQGIAYMALGDPTAEKVIKVKAKSERLPSNAIILSFDETSNDSPYIIPEILNDFYMRLKEEGIDPYLPVIQPLKDTYAINRVVLVKGSRLSKELNMDETRILNELLNTDRRGLIDVKKDENEFFVNVESFKTKTTVVIPRNTKPYVNVHIKIDGYIESSEKKLSHNYELLEDQRLASEVISNRVKSTLETIQKIGSDPLGLGLKYQAKHGVSEDKVKKWNKIYPHIQFKVKTDLKLRGTGIMY
ncbi:Ger(x)C family spore germination protein [Peribacillus kribbensis]|uniref:Ger(x)C family spore germination protein n=1 Tax=Peribacillus kribbensis TaxID=356658 RepID=UPI0004096B7F|nr:Ger(x)C family spore germination protein [Peribacillus kribbensis]